MTTQEYWLKVNDDICKGCPDFCPSKGCQMAKGENCALKRTFPDVLDAILSVESLDLYKHRIAVRENICNSCRNQDPRGNCVLRNNLDCVLEVQLKKVIISIKQTCPLYDSTI